MSERKVLNKYYPPDFDPTKIPRARQTKNRQFTVRLMAPCNMRCDTCGEYIYKGKKFNARKEDVENDTYLGIRIYRFYIKCTRCLAEISFKTDPQATDYVIEAGATRNFMALKLAEEQAEREEKAEKEEDATNPMKLLEKRTQASRHEMAVIEALEELKELNQRQVVPDYNTMLNKYDELRELEIKKREDEDEAYIKSIFGKDGDAVIKRIEDDEESDEDDIKPPPAKLFMPGTKSTDILTKDLDNSDKKLNLTKEKSVGSLTINKKQLVMVKKPTQATPSTSNSNSGLLSIKKEETEVAKPKPSTGLSLLGGYSSSSTSDSE